MNTHIREDLLPQPGAVIASQYRVDSLLGAGGMGAVFAGAHLRTGRAVAIKWMLPQAAASVEALRRFIAEAQATARVEHPNVVHIYDYGEDGGSPFLVMERLRGESLRERLDRVGRLSAADALRLLVPAMRGVAEAHREGIIHRDLKPDNIFLCEGKDGSEREAKVVDFGISKLRDGEGGSNLTGTGMMMGTPAYMSPEQLNAPKDADTRFDVYALGVVLYEAICGRCPYEAEGIFQLVGQIMTSEPTPPSQLAPGVTSALDGVILRAMHREADQRYQDVPSLIEALRGLASQPGPHALGPLPSQPGVRPMTPMTPMVGATAKLPSTPPPPQLPETAAHQTPPPQATALLQPGSYPGVGTQGGHGHPGSQPGVPAHYPGGSQPGVSHPGMSHPGPYGAPGSTAGVGAASTPYAPYPPARSGGAATRVVAGLLAVLLGSAAAGGGWYFLLGPGRPGEDPAPLAGPPPPVEPVLGSTDLAAGVAATPPGVEPPIEPAAVAGPDEPAPDEPETTEPSAAPDEPAATPEPTPRRAAPRQGRRRGHAAAPLQPVVRPVAPPPVVRPTPSPSRPSQGTNGAMIIE